MCNDFDNFLSEIGLTQQAMDLAEAQMGKPLSRRAHEPYEVKPSDIHGVGCFATKDTEGFIARVSIDSNWYEAGRYINHSHTPNAKVSRAGSFLFLKGSVKAGDEITLDYRQVRSCILGEV